MKSICFVNDMFCVLAKVGTASYAWYICKRDTRFSVSGWSHNAEEALLSMAEVISC